MVDKKEKEPKRELTHIRPDKVSLVDLGANNEFFFVAKGAVVDGDNEETDLEKAVSSYLHGISSRVSAMSDLLKSIDENGTVPHQFSALLKRTSDSVEDVKLAFSERTPEEDVAISYESRDKMVVMLDVVNEKVEVAKEQITKAADSTVDDFVGSLDDIALALDSVTESYAMTDKAVWTRAYINDLPDSAFLYIIPGGEKDDDGKTTPRSNRKFPYKNKNGKVDLPHLRNAIARIPQSKLSQDLKDKLQAKARKILAEHTDTEKSQGSEETMKEKIAAVIKSAGEVQLDVDEVEKQVGDAMSTLKEVMSALNVGEETISDFWDLRYKVGDAVATLIEAAALQGILGSGKEKQADPPEEEDEEEDMPEEKTEKAVEEETQKSSDSSKEEEKVEKKEEEAPVEKNEEEPSLLDNITKAIQSAVTPLSEKIDTLTERVEKNEEKVEKMDRTRSVQKGDGPDSTQGADGDNSEGDKSASIFAEIMPENLRGRYAHGEKVEE